MTGQQIIEKKPDSSTASQQPRPGRAKTALRKFGLLLVNIADGKRQPGPDVKSAKEPIQRIFIAKDEKAKAATYLNMVDIALDSYDDIFSDFDNSPFSKRTISVDFANEVERRYSETKEGAIQVVFSIPKKERNTKDEAVIKGRLKEYFQKKMDEVDAEVKGEQKLGVGLIFGGTVFIAISTCIGAYLESHNIFYGILREVTLIPGWVGEFLGLEKVFLEPRKMMQKKKFYQKFQDADYIFVTVEEIVKKISDTMTAKTEDKKIPFSKDDTPKSI